MCILFIYNGDQDSESDYNFILASNRDEYYDRPASNAAPWIEDPCVVGGRDMEKGREGGTWLALSPSRRRIAILLNLTGNPKQNPKGRGNIVADYVKSSSPVKEYVKKLEPYATEFNDFNLVTVEFSKENTIVQSYCNVTNALQQFEDHYLGFGNSTTETPLKKVIAGKHKFEDICKTWTKLENKENLIRDMLALLKCNERHLPDPELQRRCPNVYENLSSVCVNMPEGRYGTRTHTLILLTKTGHLEFLEVTMQPPIEPKQPMWQQTKYEFDI